eukprot:scaffold1736_cov127-Cylindrotheca_fusiformis.AAC.112
MDHLKTPEERRERWYSRKRPRYVSVRAPTNRNELLSFAAGQKDDENDEEHVYGIPFSWLLDDGLLCNILETHGFAVVTGVLSHSDCKDSLNKAWDYIEAASFAERQVQEERQQQQDDNHVHHHMTPPITRDSPNTHSLRFYPQSLEGGFLPFYGSGHTTFAWSIRSHPNVRAVFEAIYKTSDLISSLDGVVLWHKNQPPTDAGWFHLDQNPIAKPGKECIQSLVNLLPVTDRTGGNVVVPRSHKLFPHHYHHDNHGRASLRHPCSEFYQARLEELGGEDWMEIDPNDSMLLRPRSNITCLLGPGDMILWDSRTVHCSNPSSSTSSPSTTEQDENMAALEESAHGLIRAAVAVSMMPTLRATKSVLEQRRQAVTQYRTLTHWANKSVPLGAENEGQNAMESDRVKHLLAYQCETRRKVLLDYDKGLTLEQKALVVGNE